MDSAESHEKKQIKFSDEDARFEFKWHRFVKNPPPAHHNSIGGNCRVSTCYPKLIIAFVVVISFMTLATGVFTNFNVDVNEDSL